jgi:hypothetical protein
MLFFVKHVGSDFGAMIAKQDSSRLAESALIDSVRPTPDGYTTSSKLPRGRRALNDPALPQLGQPNNV